MSMKHRFFVESDQIEADEVRFAEDQAHQLRSVLRLRAGDQVRVFDGLLARDRVVELIDVVRGRIVGELPQAPEPRTRLVVYPALLQRDKFEPVLQKLTELGAAAVAPVITARGLVRDAPDERRAVRWRAIVREAAEQCGRGVVPELRAAVRFADAIGIAEGTRLVAYERERHLSLRAALLERPTAVSLFVGPEGGYTSEEADYARSAGAQLITLGPRVLRTETASPVLAALVLYELGDLSWAQHERD
jgi:16S rRNA (uracil1498-N3)-methyltransferase